MTWISATAERMPPLGALVRLLPANGGEPFTYRLTTEHERERLRLAIEQAPGDYAWASFTKTNNSIDNNGIHHSGPTR